MSRPLPVLDRVRIASPCAMGWDQMTGDDRRRFCSSCKLHVYNLSDMTTDEAEGFVRSAEGLSERTCVRFYARADGTVITRDCPVGLAAVRRRLAAMGATLFAAAGLLVAAVLGRRDTYRPDRDWFEEQPAWRGAVAGRLMIAPRPPTPTPSTPLPPSNPPPNGHAPAAPSAPADAPADGGY